MSSFRFLMTYIRKHAWSYGFGVIFIIATNWIAVSIPVYIQKSIDVIATGYRVTDSALDKVAKETESPALVEKLRSLTDTEFQKEEHLLAAVQDLLSKSQLDVIKDSLLKNTYLLDRLVENQDKLIEFVVIMFALALLMIIIRTSSRVLFFTPGRAIECEIKNDMFRKLNNLQKDYHEKNPSGSVISKMNNDVTGIRLLCGFGMLQTFNILSALSFTPFKMWQLSPSLTLYCMIPIVLVFTLVKYGMRFMVRSTRDRMGVLQSLSEFTVSSLSGVDVIKSFGMTKWIEGEFRNENNTMLGHSLKISWIRSFLLPILSNLENVLKVLILFVGGYFVINAEFTIGELTAYITYAGLLTMPLMGLGWVTTMVQQGLVGLESVKTVLDQKVSRAEIEHLPPQKEGHLFDKGIEIKNLTYRYQGQNENSLEDISFKIEPGQTIGVLGKIGSGKTTLVNCLNHYLSTNAGQIQLRGKNIGDLHDSEIRHVIRTVSQDPFLFSDTVEYNITFGCKDEACEQELDLERLIYECALEDEIRRFPQQKNTMVGEKGIMLSGGQKQRISLARAMASPCDLLILDNVLSAVDTKTESFLLKQILKKQHARSLLIVSHRAISMENADLILVLDNGKIVDQGTAQELKNRPGYFRETWLLQSHH